MTKVILKKEFEFYTNGCWPVTYPAGKVELPEDALLSAMSLGLVEDKGGDKGE